MGPIQRGDRIRNERFHNGACGIEVPTKDALAKDYRGRVLWRSLRRAAMSPAEDLGRLEARYETYREVDSECMARWVQKVIP